MHLILEPVDQQTEHRRITTEQTVDATSPTFPGGAAGHSCEAKQTGRPSRAGVASSFCEAAVKQHHLRLMQ